MSKTRKLTLTQMSRPTRRERVTLMHVSRPMTKRERVALVGRLTGHSPEAIDAAAKGGALVEVRERIEARLAEKRAEYEDYKRHLGFRVEQEDLHGIWDCGANMSEVSNYIDALLWCLAQLNGT